MQTSISRRARRLGLSTFAVAALAAAPLTGQAAGAVSDLRVEAGGRALSDASYTTAGESIATDTSRPACGGSGQTKTLDGLTALGLLATAAERRPGLRPLRISDKFSFGLLVCGVGGFTSSDTGFWLYKVNHVAPEVGGEAFKIKGGDRVLWYFQDTARNSNTGDELELAAPARAREGTEVVVAVTAYTASGARRPAAGASVFFGDRRVVADANGRAKARLAGSETVRAGRGGDIPSAPVRICVASELRDCPSARGRDIFGGERADRLTGTRGADVIRSGAGNDRIDVRGGNRDRVRCGSGRRDRVRLGRGDRATRDCEFVNGSRRAATGS